MPNDSIPFSYARAFVLGVAIVAIMFVWEGHKGFSLWDEGYLWYGVQRVMAGEIPIRDFQAYDPGRYQWSATLLTLSGSQGIMAVRTTVVILQVLSLCAVLGALAAIDRKRVDWLLIVISGLTLVVWMVPRHKVFDISISIGLVCVLAFLVQRPTVLRYFVTGLAVGVAAYFGRNHGIYGLAASLGVLFYLAVRCDNWRAWRRGVLGFAFGIVVGYLPIIVMLLADKGFAPAFIDSIKFLFDVKATNLPLPVPWPWKVAFTDGSFETSMRGLLIGLFFLGTLVFGCLSIIYVVIRKERGGFCHPLLVACAFAALPYAHYAFSRADPGHLAQGIFPTVIGILVCANSSRTLVRWSVGGALFAASWFAMIGQHPGWQCAEAGFCEEISIGSDRLLVDRGTVSDVSLLRELKQKFAPAGQSFFVAPFWPGAYALFNAKAPNWEIYTAWSRSEAFQRHEIERLQATRPAFAVIFDFPLDGRDELRYQQSHPLIDEYVRKNFERVTGMTTNSAYQIYREKTVK